MDRIKTQEKNVYRNNRQQLFDTLQSKNFRHFQSPLNAFDLNLMYNCNDALQVYANLHELALINQNPYSMISAFNMLNNDINKHQMNDANETLDLRQERSLKHPLKKENINEHNKRKKENNKKLHCGYSKTILHPVFIDFSCMCDFQPNNCVIGNIPPWTTTNKCYSGPFGLHDEIKDFCQYMSCIPEEYNIRKQVIMRLEKVVLGIWPDAKVDIFGSFKTDLCLPTSDIDVAIFGSWSTPPLHILERELRASGVATNTKVLDRASVPIVKMTDTLTKMRVDISFNMHSGLRAAKLTCDYLIQFPSLRYLIMVLKQFLLGRELNEVWTGGVSSYSLILMCVNFLQTREVQDHRNQNLGILLVEFFEHYGRIFNYQRCGIRVANGGAILPRELLQCQRSQKQNITPNVQPQLGYPNLSYSSFLCIEDPITPDNDIGRSSYKANDVQDAFRHAYFQLCEAMTYQCFYPERVQMHRVRHELTIQQEKQQDPDSNAAPCLCSCHVCSLLCRVLTVSNSVVEHRNWIRKNFPIELTNMTSTPPTADTSSQLAEAQQTKDISSINEQSASPPQSSSSPKLSYAKVVAKKVNTNNGEGTLAKQIDASSPQVQKDAALKSGPTGDAIEEEQLSSATGCKISSTLCVSCTESAVGVSRQPAYATVVAAQYATSNPIAAAAVSAQISNSAPVSPSLSPSVHQLSHSTSSHTFQQQARQHRRSMPHHQRQSSLRYNNSTDFYSAPVNYNNQNVECGGGGGGAAAGTPYRRRDGAPRRGSYQQR